MSAEAVGWVYRFSPFAGSTFQVHHALADSTNDLNNNEIWARQVWLATKARVARKTVNEALATLTGQGFLELLEDNARSGQPNRYRFHMPAGLPDKMREVSPLVTPPPREVSPEVTPGVSPHVTQSPKPLTQEDSVGGADVIARLPTAGQVRGDSYPKSFEDCWTAYPSSRRGGKKAAYAAWRASVERELREGAIRKEVLEMMLTATRKYAAVSRDKNPEYVKLAQTFWGPGEHYKVPINFGNTIEQSAERPWQVFE